jgi:glucose-1-phosphate cytidylyltransferase
VRKRRGLTARRSNLICALIDDSTGKNLKAVILAGGLGTRISEETTSRPKPMVEIGGKPMLWHIMKIYSAHGINEFIVCCGYKGYVIKEYFANYFLHMSDVTLDIEKNKIEVHHRKAEPWRVTLIDTGENTMTGGRLKRVAAYLREEDTFCFTYGDGVADVDITAELAFHRSHGKLATIMSVQPAGRYGALDVNGIRVNGFIEKPRGDGGWVNAGFSVLSSKVLEFIKDDATAWEAEPLSHLAAAGQLMADAHKGFWQPMDTLREKTLLEDMWRSGEAPWKLW